LHPGDTTQEVFDSNLHGSDARPSARVPDRDVPPELEAILVKATAADPRARFQSARDLNAAIERYLDGERDGELQREMAQRHTLAAAEAVERARTEDSPGFEERRRAMREIGRALALDPGNEQAMSLIVRLLGEPPRRLPAEVAFEMERVERGSLRWMGRIGGFAYASTFLFLPFFLWTGVRDWTWPCIFYCCVLLASAVSFWVASQRRPSRHAVFPIILFSNIAFASTAALFGPFTVAPALLAINAAAFALNIGTTYRNIAVTAGCLFMLLAIAGSLSGVVPGSYSFDGARMTLEAGAIHLPRTPTIVFLTAIAVASIFTGMVSVTRVRDKLAMAERQLYLYAWHLRELVPEAVRGPTDPTVARMPTYRRA
jgi:eukaryotic-like serine/threonine-protein kinase